MEAPSGDILVNSSQSDINEYLVWNADDNHKAAWYQKMGGLSTGNANPYAKSNQTGHKFFDQFAAMKSSFIAVAQQLNVSLPTQTLDVDDDDLQSLIQSLDKRQSIKIWYNDAGYVSSSAYLNVLSNAMLRYMLPAGTDANNYGISTYSQPIAWTETEQGFMKQEAGISLLVQALTVPMIVVLAFSIIPSSFVLFVIDERVTQAKHLQLVSGVSRVLYWLSNFVWDMMNFIVPTVLTIIVMKLFQIDILVNGFNDVVVFFVIMMLYGVAVVAVMYPLTFIFRVPATAFVFLTIMNFILGIILLSFEYAAGNPTPIKRLLYCLFPSCNLYSSLFDLVLLSINAMTGDGKIETIFDYFKWKNLGVNVTAYLLSTVLGFALLVLIEYWNMIFACCSLMSSENTAAYIDSDVAAERDAVLSDSRADLAVKFSGIGKTFRPTVCCCIPKSPIVAVNNLFAGVRRGECFGLVGLNGAGKTTTFKMLTGEETIGAGDITCYGHNVKRNMRKAHRHVGYCPQFDALNGYLTGREHLAMYARLRGISPKDVNAVVNWGIEHMNLRVHENKISKKYSGGNKRKLSTAIALVGDPDLILLDEPSSGMDPKARRYLWNRVLNVVNNGRSVVLTTHSMEECEALCNRITIMVQGNLQCLGTVQHLKSKFASGYKLTVQLEREGDAAEFGRAATELLRGSRVTDEHGATLQLHVGGGERLADALAAVAALRRRFAIVDYAIAQTSLDDVFVSFAQAQENAAMYFQNNLPATPMMQQNGQSVSVDIQQA